MADTEAVSIPPVYQAPALEKGLEIIELLSAASEPYAMADLARALGRSKSEIYRMALVLERRGYIARTPDDRFHVTNRLFELGMRSPPQRNLHAAALPVMYDVAETLRQSCHLAVASEDEIVIVARVESPGPLGFAVRVGYRNHVTRATSGQLLFALQPEAGRARWLASLRRTAPPETDLDAFLAAGERVRRESLHIASSTMIDAVTDIGAPIYDGTSPGPVAALTVPFVSGRASKVRLDDAATAVSAAAAAISGRVRHG